MRYQGSLLVLFCLLFLAISPATEAAWLFKETRLDAEVVASLGEGDIAPQVEARYEGSYRLEGNLLDNLVLLPISIAGISIPVDFVADMAWTIQEAPTGFTFTLTSQDEQCSYWHSTGSGTVLLGLGLYVIRDCTFANNKVKVMAPDREILVFHTNTISARAVGWSAIEISLTGEISLEPGGVGAGPSGTGTYVLEAEDVLPVPKLFMTDPKRKVTPSCPVERPWFHDDICKACPLGAPSYDPSSNTCSDCAAGTYWDGYSCIDTPPGRICEPRRQWSVEEGDCVCAPEYNPWRENEAAPLECLTDDEVMARVGGSGDGEWRIEDDRARGWVRVIICRGIERTEEHYETIDGVSVLVLTVIRTEECSIETIPYKAGASHLEGKACHDGLGWKACDDEPMPAWIEPHLPSIDLMSAFGPCYWVDDVQITACDGTGTQVLPSQPDLRVGPAFVENPLLVPGDPIRLRVTVSNAGGVTAPNSELEIRWLGPDGIVRPQRLWIGSLASRQSRDLLAVSDVNIQSPFTAALGAYDLELVADVAGVVAEADESNNHKSLAFLVSGAASGGPDLRVGQVVVDPQNPAVSGHVEVTLVIDNIGDQAAGPSRHRLRLTSPGGQTWVESRDSGALAPGDFLLDTVEFVADTTGGYTVEVLADAFDEVVETQDRNNRGSLLFEVYGDTPCLPCTSGAPDNQVGTAVCLDHASGIPHEGARWQCLGVRADGSSCVPSGNHPNGWAPVEDRCDPPEALCAGTLHSDRCGNPGICPGIASCP